MIRSSLWVNISCSYLSISFLWLSRSCFPIGISMRIISGWVYLFRCWIYLFFSRKCHWENNEWVYLFVDDYSFSHWNLNEKDSGWIYRFCVLIEIPMRNNTGWGYLFEGWVYVFSLKSRWENSGWLYILWLGISFFSLAFQWEKTVGDYIYFMLFLTVGNYSFFVNE